MPLPSPRTRIANRLERLGCENFRLVCASEDDPRSLETVAGKFLNAFAPGRKTLTSFTSSYPRVPR
jgi:hypothetical protein